MIYLTCHMILVAMETILVENMCYHSYQNTILLNGLAQFSYWVYSIETLARNSHLLNMNADEKEHAPRRLL